MEKKKPGNPHHGHRQRKKEQFLLSGLDNFPDHEKLEFMLYFSVPSGDTNELAHKLIDRFGSFAGVINAERDELFKVVGVGEHTATMLAFFKMAARHYIMETTGGIMELNSTPALMDYCKALFIGAGTEQVHCLYLGENYNLLNCDLICEGGISKVEINLAKIISQGYLRKASHIVMAHNHPNGSCIPSKADVDITQKINDIFLALDMKFADHVIIGMDGVWSMRESDSISNYYTQGTIL